MFITNIDSYVCIQYLLLHMSRNMPSRHRGEEEV